MAPALTLLFARQYKRSPSVKWTTSALEECLGERAVMRTLSEPKRPAPRGLGGGSAHQVYATADATDSQGIRSSGMQASQPCRSAPTYYSLCSSCGRPGTSLLHVCDVYKHNNILSSIRRCTTKPILYRRAGRAHPLPQSVTGYIKCNDDL